jgi:hypothetical protein
MRRIAVVIAIVLGCAAGASAQEPPKVQWAAGGAAVAPLSGTADYFKIGVGADASATIHLSEQTAVKIDALYAALGGKSVPASVSPLPVDASYRAMIGTVDFVFLAPPGPYRLYLLGGVGVYHRTVSLTASGSGSATVCSPWWFVCQAQPSSASQLSGSRSANSVGINVGVGVSARRYFVEVRYHYAGGPTSTSVTGETHTATGKFFPLIVGIYF